ncbi:Non-catalytic module family EXPN protein [Schizophyllum fasciatum]
MSKFVELCLAFCAIMAVQAAPNSGDGQAREQRASDEAYDATATYYDPNGATSECGRKLLDTDAFAAVAVNIFNKDLCGKTIVVSHDDKQIEVPVEEMCAACDNNGLALSPAAYKQLASLVEKTIAVQWDFSA